MNPNQIITPYSHKNVPPAVAEFLHRLKSVGKANSKKAGAILLCALALTGATKVIAESAVSSTSSQADKTYKQEVTLKDGKKISFADLSKLSEAELELTLVGANRSEQIFFWEWQYEEIMKEVMKDNARIDARHEEVMKERARIDAGFEEAVKEGIKGTSGNTRILLK